MNSNGMKTLLELAHFINEFLQEEKNKLPYHINLIDELHINENAHTRILLKLLSYQEKGDYPLLDSFLRRMRNKSYSKTFPIHCLNHPIIRFNHENLDGLIEESSLSYAVIIENKVNGAVDQNTQIERYVQTVLNHGVAVHNIYVIYLTRDGSKRVQDFSLTKKVQELLEVKNPTENGRFIEMNYKDDILPWLQEDVWSQIKVKDILLSSAVQQYVDFLQGLLHLRPKESIMYKKMDEHIINQLHLNNVSDLKRWHVYAQTSQELQVLQTSIQMMQKEIGESAIDSWHRASLNQLDESFTLNNQINNGYYQICMSPLPDWIHFEWIPLNVDSFFQNDFTYCLVLHIENGNDKYWIDCLLRNEIVNTIAKSFGFNYYMNKTTAYIKYLKTPQGKPFIELSGKEKMDFFKEAYEGVLEMKEGLQSTYLLLDGEKGYVEEIQKKLIQETSANWQCWHYWDLYVSFNDNSHKIGIEASYGINTNKQIEFRIYITVWDKSCWTKEYKQFLQNKFPEAFKYKLDEDAGNRVFLHFPPILLGDKIDVNETMIYRMKDIYDIMKDMTDHIH